MRPTSSLSLLLFLKLTTSTPIPHHRDYHEYESPLEPDFAKPATPPTTLSNPHFPPHQLQSLNADSQFDKPFDNRPKTPPAEIPPSVALSTETPLTSAYLLYIIRPPPSTIELPSTTTSDEEEALPSKPTAALAQLRKLDSVRYWASLQPNASPKPKIVPPTLPTFEQLKFEEKEFPESETSSNEGPVSSIMRCQEYIMGAGSNAYMSMSLARDYGDLLVVGIVVLFLGLVVVSEVIIKAVDLRRTVFGSRRGEIYLPDDDCDFEFYMEKQPFYLQPPPPGKYRIIKYNDYDMDEDMNTDTAGNVDVMNEKYYHESDAFEKV